MIFCPAALRAAPETRYCGFPPFATRRDAPQEFQCHSGHPCRCGSVLLPGRSQGEEGTRSVPVADCGAGAVLRPWATAPCFAGPALPAHSGMRCHAEILLGLCSPRRHCLRPRRRAPVHGPGTCRSALWAAIAVAHTRPPNLLFCGALISTATVPLFVSQVHCHLVDLPQDAFCFCLIKY